MRYPRIPLDLLASRPVHAVTRSRWFPLSLQVLTLVVVVALAYNALGLGSGMGDEVLDTLRQTNLTMLLVWAIWWPGMIVVVLGLGRVWCTVCPMELVNRVGDAVARKVGWPRARLGKFLRAGWMVIVVYLVLQFLVAGASLHDVPRYTGLMLFALIAVALFTGLVFNHPRAFCKAFCPAGALLSVYSRYTPIQLEARDPAVCDKCPTKDCIRREDRFRFDKRSCPSLLKPYHRAASDGCVLCLQCVKVCPYENMGFGIVAADAPVRRKPLLRPYEAAFVVIELGFVVHELSEDVAALDAVFRFIPAKLAALLSPASFHWIEAVWFLALFPLLVWVLAAIAGYIAGHRAGLRAFVLAAATGAAPVVALAHLTKAVGKLAAWGGYLPLALRDPRGLETLTRLEQGVLARPDALLGLSIVGWMMLPVILVVAWRAWRWARELPADLWVAARTGMIAAVLVFSPLLIVWGSSGG